MTINFEVLLTILGMATVTYATRAGGLWLMNRVTLSRRVEIWLSYIPGTVLVALVAPGVITGGPAALLAGLLTVLVAARTKSLLAAMVAGVVLIWALRTFFGLP